MKIEEERLISPPQYQMNTCFGLFRLKTETNFHECCESAEGASSGNLLGLLSVWARKPQQRWSQSDVVIHWKGVKGFDHVIAIISMPIVIINDECWLSC